MINCHEMRCPFEYVCKYRDAYTDRSDGCATKDFIVAKAQDITIQELAVNNHHVISERGMDKIQKIKWLRDETGADLKTCVDALKYGGDLVKAMDYIKYGW